VPFFYQGVPLHFKSKKPKDYSENPQSLGEHLKKRRKELGLLQREAAIKMEVSVDTLINWENNRTKPVAAQFKPIVAFLGYDPSPLPRTLAERVSAKQRALGASLAQVARHLGWDAGSLRRYLDGTWQISTDRKASLEAFLIAGEEALVGLLALKRRR
jgi:DNA-binding XRE family transcriptional regulator